MVSLWLFGIFPPLIKYFFLPLLLQRKKKCKTVLFDAGIIDSEFLQNCFPSYVAETLGLEKAFFPFSL